MKTIGLKGCLERLDRAEKRLRFDRRPAVVIVACPEVRPTALEAIRCLGRKGVPVVAVAAQHNPPSFASKFSKVCLRCPNQKESPDEFIEFMAELGRRISPRPALEFCSDYDTVIVSSNADKLSPVYDCPYLSPETLMLFIDKWQMLNAAMDAGFDVPELHLVKTRDDLEGALGCELPAVVKPLGRFNWDGTQVKNQETFMAVFHSKGIRATSPGELTACLDTVIAHGMTALVQAEVPGPVSGLRALVLYADRGSNVLAEFHGRKIRQVPSDFGSGSLAVPVPPNPELSRLCKAFVERTHFHGMAAFEWKLDPRDEKYKFMEVNPRCWTWTILSDAVGVNLPYVQHLEITGQDVPELVQQDVDVRFVDLLLDWSYYWYYRKGDHTGTPISLWQWLRPLRGRRELAWLARGDRMPGFLYLWRFAADLPRRVFKKLCRMLRIGRGRPIRGKDAR